MHLLRLAGSWTMFLQRAAAFAPRSRWCLLLIRFAHVDGAVTPALPQAVMDHRNNAIPYDKITARDITDTQRRGMCMAAAMHLTLL